MRILLAGIVLPLLAACSEPPEDVMQRQVFAVGTLVEFTLVNPPDNADAALHDAEQALLDAERRWRAWGDGELAALNRELADKGRAAASPELLAGIREARRLAEASGNRFNPAIGRLVELWGFHEEERPAGGPPLPAEINDLIAPPLDPAAIEISANGIRTDDPRTWLDMGAFAKGIAVEAAIDALRSHGIDNAIVNAGGDLKTLGRHGERPWHIGIRHPSGRGVVAALDISGANSVFTSGNYERRFQWKGETYHHILDPVTGLPARGLASVTVVHPDAALADAAATALFVAGPEDWQATARTMGIDAAMVVHDNGRVEVSESLREQLHVEANTVVETVKLSEAE